MLKRKNKDYQFLNDLYEKTYQIKNELEEQVTTSKDSFGKIYGVIKKLDSLEPDKILSASIDILKEFLECNSISIYKVNKGYLRLSLRSSNKDLLSKNSLILSKLKEVEEELNNGKIFIRQ